MIIYSKLKLILKCINPFYKKVVVSSLIIFFIYAAILSFLVLQEVDSTKRKLESDLNAFNETLNLFYKENGYYPDSLDKLIDMNYLIEIPERDSILFQYHLKKAKNHKQ